MSHLVKYEIIPNNKINQKNKKDPFYSPFETLSFPFLHKRLIDLMIPVEDMGFIGLWMYHHKSR